MYCKLSFGIVKTANKSYASLKKLGQQKRTGRLEWRGSQKTPSSGYVMAMWKNKTFWEREWVKFKKKRRVWERELMLGK